MRPPSVTCRRATPSPGCCAPLCGAPPCGRGASGISDDASRPSGPSGASGTGDLPLSDDSELDDETALGQREMVEA